MFSLRLQAVQLTAQVRLEVYTAQQQMQDA
jgi:hypothetical protein